MSLETTIQTPQIGTPDFLEWVKQQIETKKQERVSGLLSFYNRITADAEEGWPSWTQAIRMMLLQENKRLAVADDTGVNGKTFQAVGSKVDLDRQHGKRHPTLVVAPNSGLEEAWHPSEIDGYAKKLVRERVEVYEAADLNKLNDNTKAVYFNWDKLGVDKQQDYLDYAKQQAPQAYVLNQKVVTIRNYDDLTTVTEDTDFMVINWEKLSIPEFDRKWGRLKGDLEYAIKKGFIEVKDEYINDTADVSLFLDKLDEQIAKDKEGNHPVRLKRHKRLKSNLKYARETQVLRADEGGYVLDWNPLQNPRLHKRWKQLKEALERLNPDMYVIDEAHQARGKLRGGTIRRINKSSLDDYMLLLSATMIPNRFKDLGIIFELLDPEHCNADQFAYQSREAFKLIWDKQMWIRITRGEMKEVLGLGEFIEKEPAKACLTNEEAKIYLASWQRCIDFGKGLSDLRKLLFDPFLSDYAPSKKRYTEEEVSELVKWGKAIGVKGFYHPEDEHNVKPGHYTYKVDGKKRSFKLGLSSRLKRAKEIADAALKRGEKVIIKTSYVEEVIGNVAHILGGDKEMLVVSGATPLDVRKWAYTRFRDCSGPDMLLVSPVAEESVNLSAGEQDMTIISLEPEMTIREERQLTGRGYRRGQKGNVVHQTIMTMSYTLQDMMIEYMGDLGKLGVKVPKKFEPRTICEDMYTMRVAKQEVAELFYALKPISKKQQGIWDVDTLNNALNHLLGIVRLRELRMGSPFGLATLIQTKWQNTGEEEFKELVQTPGWRDWTKLYEQGWEGSESQKTLGVANTVIDWCISQKNWNYEPEIVDVGMGAAYFSRVSGKSVTGIDVDLEWMLTGEKKIRKKKLDVENQYFRGSATSTGLESKCANIVLNSYSLFYLGQEKEGKRGEDARSEIEAAVLETNRILITGGYFVLALPHSLDATNMKRLRGNICEYGFKEARYIGPGDTEDCKSYIMAFEKVKSVRKKLGKDLSLYDDLSVVSG